MPETESDVSTGASEIVTVARLLSEVNRHKTDGVRDLGPVDATDLREDVLALPENAWDRPEDFAANYNKKKAIRQASHVIFRFSDRRESLIRYIELPSWRKWADRLLPVMHAAVRAYGYAAHFFPRVMLARLPAGAFIPPHVDGDARGFVPHKIHVPILTNPEAYFFLDRQRHHLAEGRAWEVNNGVTHSVVNNGDSDRIHLIFEYLDADAQQFER